SLLSVPIHGARDDERPGAVLVFFAEPRRFTDDELEVAHHLAGAAEGALERSGVYEEERTARSLAQQLSRTSSLLATELDPAAVLDEVVRQAPRLVAVEACAIRVLDGDELVVSVTEGPGTDAALGARSPATGWLSGDVVQSRERVAVEDAALDDRLLAADPLLAGGYRAYLGVPLAAPEGALHGVLAVYASRPKEWRNEEIEALRALAGTASAALSSAELYQRVALEKERSVAILANIADGIVAVDRGGSIVLWNSTAEQITGVPAPEALGRRIGDVLQRDLGSEDGAAAGEREIAIVRGGNEVWLSVTEAVMHDAAGGVVGRIFAFRDVSGERAVEQMKSDFVATVSHELRTPLTSIYGFAETLRRRDVGFGESERETFLGYIASESERLIQIVDDLLSVARLDAGTLGLALAPTDVADVVRETVERFTGEGEARHRFVLDLPDAALVADADRARLGEVVHHLVDNAVKYSSEGGTIVVSARRTADAVQVRVVDEGAGIPLAERQRIFTKFFRGDTGGQAPAHGTGIGLFLARGLLAGMNGRIWVESSEGRGSAFVFELPVSNAARAGMEGVETEDAVSHRSDDT
ncbi:MAG: ATP-binding protein, partial [Actinomycetota bacterium]|nr:ATP-binding protein [Actinomycetota bacterium]